jgi:3-deoxy-D-manno-octulosonic-acid transferase
MFLTYNILLTIFSPFWLAWMFFRTSKREQKPIWKERTGDYDIQPRKDRKRIWFHAVSVGEVVAVLPLIREVRLLLPDFEFILSVTTSSGHSTALEQSVGIVDRLFYFPIDVPRFQLAAMQHVQPAVVAIMETELWWNFLWAAKTFRAKTLLVNGRISDRSYPRNLKLAFYYRNVLRDLDQCLMQSPLDAERIESIGGQNVRVFGNVKFDQAIDDIAADPEEWKDKLKIPDGRPIIVIGSTRGQEEEDLVISAIKELGEDSVCVVHAPRHLERVPDLAKAVRAQFGSVALRSKGEGGPYIVLDTYGELSRVYSVADIVVIGGGFESLGGQSIFQPLAHGKPVIHGPHMHNFRDVAAAAHAAGATRVVTTASELSKALDELIRNPAQAEEMGAAAKKFISENLGASRRYAEAIIDAASEALAEPSRRKK